MPCLVSERWKALAISASTPGMMRSRNSTTVTSAPRRRQTEPSSSPMMPAPITTSVLGTSGSDSAPVESTMRFWSTVTPGSARGLRAGGDDDVLGVERALGAVLGRDLDLAGAGDAARALDPLDLVLLEQELDALGQRP